MSKSRRSLGAGRRSTADRVQAQGTGRAVAKAFGCGNRQTAMQSIPRLPRGSWDAFSTSHAPLPRSVGAYTVVRTTRLVTTTSPMIMVGSFQSHQGSLGTERHFGRPTWSNVVMAEQADNGTGIIQDIAATKFYGIPMPVQGDATGTLCPAALSVQVMGTSALSAASGQVAAAVLPVRLDLTDSRQTWGQVQSEFISYFRPRLMSAGKLTLRGVQMDAHPLSMNDVSAFHSAAVWSEANEPAGSPARQWNANTGSAVNLHPCGWSPMAIFNPAGAELSLLITVEWRVRFELANPAVASHTHHGVSSDYSWDAHLLAATKALPGVIDIVEKVANAGMAIASRMARYGGA